jgi:hypothetical protein
MGDDRASGSGGAEEMEGAGTGQADGETATR